MSAETPKISIATSIRYGNYREFFDEALFMTATIINRYDEIAAHINLPRDLFIHIRPIRNVLGRAFYHTKEKNKVKSKVYCLELDARQNEDDFYDTLLHELIHIEQFHEERLLDPDVRDHFKWNGDLICFRGLTLEEYMSLPWEFEAITRSIELKSLIFN
jgi:hypothetical protein